MGGTITAPPTLRRARTHSRRKDWKQAHPHANKEQLLRLSAGSNGGEMAQSQSHRRVLASVSPNVKPVASTPAFMKKPTAGSPLKRSFTAAMEEGGGLLYLKRRRLTEDEVLSETSANVSYPRQELLINLPLNDASVRSHCKRIPRILLISRERLISHSLDQDSRQRSPIRHQTKMSMSRKDLPQSADHSRR